MNRSPGSGSVMVTGAASRSNTPVEYSVSRLERMIVWRIDVDELAMMRERAEPALVRELLEVHVRFGTVEVVGRDREHGTSCQMGCASGNVYTPSRISARGR